MPRRFGAASLRTVRLRHTAARFINEALREALQRGAHPAIGASPPRMQKRPRFGRRPTGADRKRGLLIPTIVVRADVVTREARQGKSQLGIES